MNRRDTKNVFGVRLISLVPEGGELRLVADEPHMPELRQSLALFFASLTFLTHHKGVTCRSLTNRGSDVFLINFDAKSMPQDCWFSMGSYASSCQHPLVDSRHSARYSVLSVVSVDNDIHYQSPFRGIYKC